MFYKEEEIKKMGDEELIEHLKNSIESWHSWSNSSDGSDGACYYMQVAPLEDEAIERGLIKSWKDVEE